MNWITKFIKPKIKSLFEKKSSKIEENLWTTCGCKNLIYKEDLESKQKVCPKCGAHHKLTCRERFKTFFDNKEFELIETPLPKDDPLNFEDNKKYTDRLKSARKITNQNDAVSIAKGKVKEIDVVVYLAEIVGDPACSAKPEDALKTNYLSVLSFANLCSYLAIEKFIYTSSCSVYGLDKNNNLLNIN